METRTQGAHHAKIGDRLLLVKEGQRFLANHQKLREKYGMYFFPHSPQKRTDPAGILTLWASSF